MILQFDVINQKIVRKDDNYIVANSQYYLQIDFNFTRDWEGCIKLATFRNGQNVVTIEIKDNSCVVPWEVIKTPAFMFSIVGKRDETVITTDVEKVIIKPTGDKDGCEPKPPSKQIWEGLVGGQNRMVLGKNSDDNFDYNFKWVQDLNYDENTTMDEKLNTLVPKRLSILPTLDSSANNDTTMLYADNNGVDSKISVSGLRDRVIKQSDTIPEDLQVGEYLFLEIKED